MTVPCIRILGAEAEGFAGIAAGPGATVECEVLRGATGRRA